MKRWMLRLFALAALTCAFSPFAVCQESLTPAWFAADFADELTWAPADVMRMIRDGNYSAARERLGALREAETDAGTRERLAWTAERLRRIQIDYSLTLDDLRSEVTRRFRGVQPGEIARWLMEGRFDFRTIDGEPRFLYAAARNLFFEGAAFRERRVPPPDDAFEKARLGVAREVINGSGALSDYASARRYRIRFTITVPEGTVKPGEMVRCWAPYPLETPYQHSVRLISAEPEPKAIGREDAPQRSLYFEAATPEKRALAFTAEYEFIAEPRYQTIDPARVTDEVPAEAAEFALERAPHCEFRPELAELSNRLCAGESNPYYKARRIYDWIAANTHYRYAREYSTIPNISRYVFQNRYGDCGEIALLFMTLCRIQGVPARWESGWMIYPEGKNLHDWVRIYLHPYGWVPVDPNFGMEAMSSWVGLSDEDRLLLHEFFFGRMDTYRMIVNSDHSRPHEPGKTHWRSDPVDFQRGEVETAERNLYFDEFDYSLRILESTPVR